MWWRELTEALYYFLLCSPLHGKQGHELRLKLEKDISLGSKDSD